MTSLQTICKACRQCCIWGNAVVSQKDIAKISQHLNITKKYFILTYCLWIESVNSYVLHSDINNKGCIFLTSEGCSIYTVRPIKCQLFPRAEHIDKELLEICNLARFLYDD